MADEFSEEHAEELKETKRLNKEFEDKKFIDPKLQPNDFRALYLGKPIQKNDYKALEDLIGYFLSETTKKGEMDYDGNILIPYSLIAWFTEEYMIVKRNKKTKNNFLKDQNIMFCKECTSKNIHVEKRPDGNVICQDCGAIYKHSPNFNPKQGITHMAVCTNCNSTNYVSGHVIGEIELCQCCKAPYDDSIIYPVSFQPQPNKCNVCDGDDFVSKFTYGVNYSVCTVCGTIYTKK